MYIFLVKTTFMFYIIYSMELGIVIHGKQIFRNILGPDVKLSSAPQQTLSSVDSFIACALKCEHAPECQAFNLRKESRICELSNNKEVDIFNQSGRENGLTYYEKVFFLFKKKQLLWHVLKYHHACTKLRLQSFNDVA